MTSTTSPRRKKSQATDTKPVIGETLPPRKRGRPFVKEQEALEAHILTTARSLFWDVGFGKATMDEIAVRARISKRTLYQKFPTKTVLFESFVNAQLKVWVTHSDLNPMVVTNSLEEAIHYHVSHQLMAIKAPELANLMRLLAFEHAKFPELVKYVYETTYQGRVLDVANDIRKYAEIDGVPCQDAERAAIEIRGMISGISTMYLYAEGGPDEAVLADRLTQLIMVSRPTW